jgi:hypothetical protein
MKKTLIDPTTTVQHIVSWVLNTTITKENSQKYIPVYETYENSARVCEVQDLEFSVAPPLFWMDCADDIIADHFYYDTVTQTINNVVNALPPSTQGLQTV